MNIPDKMDALVWVAPRKMEMQRVAVPVPAPEEVLIRVRRVGICGSELSGYLGHNALRVPPLIMGHEFSGEIVSLGEKSLSLNSTLAHHQQVTVNPMIFCRECQYCLEGQTHLCANRRLIGAHRPGAFAEFVSAPAWVVKPLNDQMDNVDGALVEPAACALRITKLIGDCTGKSILIVGAGAIGLLALQILKNKGAKQIYISDPDSGRRKAAQEAGGEVLDPQVSDVGKIAYGCYAAVDAVGKAITREQCIRSVRSGGKVILSGLHEETSLIPVAEVIRREISLLGSFCYSMDNFSEAMLLLSEMNVHLSRWAVEVPLVEGEKWFDQLCSAQPGGIAKVILIP